MNPRFRRLLIPGLLVALLVVVLVAAVARRADSATPQPAVASTLVSRIDDPRITESSGLAASTAHDDLAYTVNDSGNAPIVFAVRISTGKVVGTTRIQGATWLDTEAMALRDGTLWVADTGDNARGRTDAALYALDEPGPGDHTVAPTRYPVSYDSGPQNVEAIAVPPDSGPILLLSKAPTGGHVFRLPATLRENATNLAAETDRPTPVQTTDATYTADGRKVLVRNYLDAQVRDAETWKLIRTDVLPDQQLGESIALEPSGRSFLIGSEGPDSALLRVAFDPDATDPSPTPGGDASSPPASSAEPGGDTTRVPLYVVAGVVVVVVLAAGVVIARRRSRTS
jgi:hypothetical protein